MSVLLLKYKDRQEQKYLPLPYQINVSAHSQLAVAP